MGVAFGIFLGLAGSLFINTGNNLQSLGMHQADIDRGQDEDEADLCKNKTWLIGTVVFVAGALLNFASYGFAPQSTLASLESIQFVSNLFFGWYLLEKTISQKMMFGTSLTVGGTVLAVVFSSKDAAEIEDVDDLVQLWNNEFWISYVVLLGALALLLQLAYKKLERTSEQKEKEKIGSSKELENIMAVIYAVISALFGTLSVVFAKLLAKLFELQGGGENIFAHWYTYVTILSWLVLMGFWLYRLNAALSLYNPLFIIPLLQANFIFFAIVSGGIYFQEFNYMIKLNWIGFIFGIVFMFMGIALLVPPKSPETPAPKVQTLQLDAITERSHSRQHSTGSIKQEFKKGCCRGGAVKLLMTGPARMYEGDYFEKTQTEFKKAAFETQDTKRLNADQAEFIKKIFLASKSAEKMQESENILKMKLNNGNFDEEEVKKVQDLMRDWNKSHEEVKSIKKMIRKKSKDKQNESTAIKTN